MGRASHDSIKNKILKLLQRNGGSMGNYVIMQQLACNEDTYWNVRDQLIDQGLVVTWPGRGGSLKLVEAAPAPVRTKVPKLKAGTAKSSEPPDQAEARLYDPIIRVLKDHWTRDNRIVNFVIECTARQGRRYTGGTWSRPDIVVVSMNKLQYVPGISMDVISFEVKAISAITVTAIYEALAHLRSANKAYALLHVPADWANDQRLAERIDSIKEEAVRHGVGLIVAEEVGNYATWNTLVEAERHDTDPHRINEFVTFQLADDNRNILEGWCSKSRLDD